MLKTQCTESRQDFNTTRYGFVLGVNINIGGKMFLQTEIQMILESLILKKREADREMNDTTSEYRIGVRSKELKDLEVIDKKVRQLKPLEVTSV